MHPLLLLTALILPALTACSPSHCEADGVQYKVCDTYTCEDGCNTCECTADGVNQTDMACNTDTATIEGGDDSSTNAE